VFRFPGHADLLIGAFLQYRARSQNMPAAKTGTEKYRLLIFRQQMPYDCFFLPTPPDA
jgi:hypothetical protein